MDKQQLNAVYEYLESHKDEMISTLEEVVRLESYSKDVEDVAICVQKFRELFEKEGFECETVDVGANGPTLLGVLGKERGGQPVLFSGHLDTVITKGAYENTFRIEGNKAFGPGALDMKGGVVIALFTIKALNSIGFNERPIKIAFSGDEEIGHFGSRGAEVLREAAEGAICAFNLETGLINNTLCFGRKGRVLAHVNVTGVESHAGNDFSSGRNAIEEMAHKIIEIQNLTNLEKGTTVTCSIIKGGTVNNAVPANCYLEAECRYETFDEMENFKKNLIDICSKNHVEGTSSEVYYSTTFAPYETTEQVMNFFNFIKDTAKECQLEEVRGKYVGGSSDASYIQLAGTPVICSIGIQGEWNHTMREYALLDSMANRGKLLASVVLNLENFK